MVASEIGAVCWFVTGRERKMIEGSRKGGLGREEAKPITKIL
jgi:hypothetical protein